MKIWEIILIGIGLSMDASAVALCNGLLDKKMKIQKALLIAFMFGIFQGIMPLLGYFLGTLFTGFITNFAFYLASGVLIFLGGKMIWEQWKKKDEVCVLQTFTTLLVQAVATSIDAFLVGLTFAALSVEVFSASLIIALITFCLSMIFVYLGKKFGEILKNKAILFGGLILVGIGLKILIDGLMG
jgi:putative Mn2+ efflux pump MntP